ncbi:Hypothetical_protein [Hexamita inflata]|uniref:Hypothetical_protein n=1 Tax=Hexamita inflata TaxID=28002 RepID=A0ABP1JFS6_9EUKA
MDDKYKLIQPAHDIKIAQIIDKNIQNQQYDNNLVFSQFGFKDEQLQKIFSIQDAGWHDQFIARTNTVRQEFKNYKNFFIQFFNTLAVIALISVPICLSLEIHYICIQLPKIQIHLTQMYNQILDLGKNRFKDEQKRDNMEEYQIWF